MLPIKVATPESISIENNSLPLFDGAAVAVPVEPNKLPSMSNERPSISPTPNSPTRVVAPVSGSIMTKAPPEPPLFNAP